MKSGRTACSVDGCEKWVQAEGVCKKHLYRLRRYGDPLVTAREMDDPMRGFFAKIDKNGPTAVLHLGPCWVWKGAKTRDRYASIRWQGRTRPGHVVSYEIHVGPVPAGLELDHLCRVRGCVNPEHLEPVTRQENVIRGDRPRLLREWHAAKRARAS